MISVRIGIRTGELVADVDTKPASLVKHPVALAPDQIEIVDVVLIGVVVAYLLFCAVVLELPVGRRGDDQMNRLVIQLHHPSRITNYYFVKAHAQTDSMFPAIFSDSGLKHSRSVAARQGWAGFISACCGDKYVRRRSRV